MASLGATIKGRSGTQANANTETLDGEVKRVYTDSVGNVTHADVRPSGRPNTLVKVPNASGIGLWQGAVVQMNWSKGSKLSPVITGAGDAGSGSAVSAASAAATTGLGDSDSGVDFSASPFLVAAPVEGLDQAYMLAPGANALLESTLPVTTSGGLQPGTLRISVKPMVVTSLPNPATSGLPDGTLLDLVDSYFTPLGMYRLDKTAGVWRRRDVGTGTGGGGSVPVFVGATSSTPGVTGTTPAPAAGDQLKFQRGDGTWQYPPASTATGTPYHFCLADGLSPTRQSDGSAGVPKKTCILPTAADGSTLWFTLMTSDVCLATCSTSSTNTYDNNTTVVLEKYTGALTGAFARPYGSSPSNGEQICNNFIAAGAYGKIGASVGMGNITTYPKSGDRICSHIVQMGIGTDGYTHDVWFLASTTDPSADGGEVFAP